MTKKTYMTGGRLLFSRQDVDALIAAERERVLSEATALADSWTGSKLVNENDEEDEMDSAETMEHCARELRRLIAKIRREESGR